MRGYFNSENTLTAFKSRLEIKKQPKKRELLTLKLSYAIIETKGSERNFAADVKKRPKPAYTVPDVHTKMSLNLQTHNIYIFKCTGRYTIGQTRQHVYEPAGKYEC